MSCLRNSTAQCEIGQWSGYLCTISSVSKSKTNGEYYQKSDYRLLRINTLFLIW